MVWITVAMAGARSFAMAANRLIAQSSQNDPLQIFRLERSGRSRGPPLATRIAAGRTRLRLTAPIPPT